MYHLPLYQATCSKTGADAETAYFSITPHFTSNRSKEEPPMEGFFVPPLEEMVVLHCGAPEPLQFFT